MPLPLPPLPARPQIMRSGTDVTLIGFGRMVGYNLKAAELLEQEGISAEVVNLRSLKPLDRDTITASVRKTHRVVSVEEGWPQHGLGAGGCGVVWCVGGAGRAGGGGWGVGGWVGGWVGDGVHASAAAAKAVERAAVWGVLLKVRSSLCSKTHHSLPPACRNCGHRGGGLL